MYAVAGRLDPDSYYALASATYREMAAAGITAVGEFHYLHHQPDGTPYDDANAMGHALVSAARDAGIRIALLDTCYLSSGFGAAVEGVQVRYSDGSADAWADRVRALEDLGRGDGVVVGAAIHSVRAVPDDALARVVAAAEGRPLHVHLSEQRAENDACVAAYGATPTQLLADHGALGPRTSAVHATHLTEHDIGHLGGSGTRACFCPTTERDLGDGVGPSRALHDAGSPLTLGSDSHAVIDLFEEMRAVELDERLATERRGHWTAAELVDGRHDDRPRQPGLRRRRRDRGRAACRPGHARHRERRAPPAPAATSTPRCSPPPRPTSRRSWSTAGWSSARETPTRSAATWPPRSRGCGDDEHRDHPHRRADHQRPRPRGAARDPRGRCAGDRGRHGGLGRVRGRRPGRRHVRRRRRPRRAARASSTATRTWCSPATGRPSSPPG